MIIHELKLLYISFYYLPQYILFPKQAITLDPYPSLTNIDPTTL